MVPLALMDNLEVMAIRPASDHPADYYLWIVLRNIGGHHPFVTHLYNSQEGGYSSGHYFAGYTEALNDFCTR
jgi:hypothetical protein